jgi:hypothetical protein
MPAPTATRTARMTVEADRVPGAGHAAKLAEILNRWPSAGVAAGVVRDGSLAWYSGVGVADIGSKDPIAPDTVFRIASITKTFTAIAVMQLCERGLVDLDAPASEYLRSFRLVPAEAGYQPTVRAGRAFAWARVQIAASTFDFPTLGPPTSAQTRPGANPTDRAGRNPRIRTSRTPNSAAAIAAP